MEPQELNKEIIEISNKSNNIVVVDQITFTNASSVVLECDQLIKEIKEYWKDPKKVADDAHKAVVTKEKEMLTPVNSYRQSIANKINAYITEQRRKEEEAQMKLDKES